MEPTYERFEFQAQWVHPTREKERYISKSIRPEKNVLSAKDTFVLSTLELCFCTR